jgi:hypothetical protein
VAQDNLARQQSAALPADIELAVAKSLAEQLRLRAWLTIISNCNAESSSEDRYARRIRFMARRALAGEPV